MESAILHFTDKTNANDTMVRILILDISGMYTSIYDEFWCYESEVNERIQEFRSPDYICIRVE